MARILPDETDAARARGAARQELETLDLLEHGLSDEYTVFHGVHWAHAEDGGSVYGEIDFLVVNRYGRVLAIEQKNGRLDSTRDDLTKTYANGAKSVRAQVARNIGHLRREFARRYPQSRLDVDHLLYCPDDHVAARLPAGIDPDRVVDAADARWLPDRIAAIFERRPMPEGADAAAPLDVHAFLSEQVELVPDVDALHRLAHAEYRRLAGGLATWARRLSMTPHRLRVTGTAGSGKTQLALQELADAHARGASALYVCFNRPLAERMRAAAAPGTYVTTFHELGATLMRETGTPVDWTSDDAFARVAACAVEAAHALRDAFDVLVVDEGQDFEPAWADAIVGCAGPRARALWLEDPDQNLYRRERVALPGWVGLASPVNYRSPRTLVTLIDALGLTEGPMQAGSAVHGFDPQMRAYADEAGLLRATDEAVAALLAEGHACEDVAVLGWHGLGRSPLHRQAAIAGRATRRFTGRYDDAGNAIHTEGELVVETVHRFKGQAADCVVIAGMDFESWSDDVARRLYVAMTRARLKVTWVVSDAAERCLVQRLQDTPYCR